MLFAIVLCMQLKIQLAPAWKTLASPCYHGKSPRSLLSHHPFSLTESGLNCYVWQRPGCTEKAKHLRVRRNASWAGMVALWGKKLWESHEQRLEFWLLPCWASSLLMHLRRQQKVAHPCGIPRKCSRHLNSTWPSHSHWNHFGSGSAYAILGDFLFAYVLCLLK